ncbi:MAG: general secretion pathway protein GspK [Planctomycetes bacterium]|nr:general secretion pathway protein GspK [Planctomycetota bacterium]MBL7008071.1 general secretion pathway protein GspK [Planctomycetota bacterium]
MRTRPGAASDAARGVVLILTLFVILITYALVAQLTLGTSVASQTSRNAAMRIRMRSACTSASQQIMDTLIDDAAGGLGGAASEMGAAMGEGLGGLGQPGADPAAEGAEGEEEAGSDADSFEDGWAKTMRIMMGEIEVMAFVQDENSKFNLLTMLSDDEELQDDARDRCAAILDRLRSEFDDDLDQHEADRLRDEIAAWLEGRDRDEDYPRPARHSNPEDAEWTLPYALEELMVLELVDEQLFYDQPREDDRLAPGLESVFTVYTSIDLDPPEAGQLEGQAAAGEEGADPAAIGAAAAEGLGQDPSGEGAAENLGPSAAGGLKGAAQGEPAIGARININTAPRPVLEGMFLGSEFPQGLAEEILEYRNEVDEEALEELESEEYDPELAELEQAYYGEEKADPKLFFGSLDDLDKLDSFETMESTLQQKFRDLVEVKSDVFSVYLFARVPPRDWLQKERYQEPPGQVLRLRAVFWRRVTEDGAKFIPIHPWHEVPFMRWRLPDFPEDLPLYEPPEY